MEVRFFLDPETELPHMYEHGVTEAEVIEVLARRGLVVKGRGESQIALGQTAGGRYLKVVYAPARDAPGVFVITAHELRGKELKAYRRRKRRNR